MPSCQITANGKLVGLGLEVREMESRPVQQRSARDALASQREPAWVDRDGPMMSDDDETVSTRAPNYRIERLA